MSTTRRIGTAVALVTAGACGTTGDGFGAVRDRVADGSQEFERTAPEMMSDADASGVGVVELRVESVDDGVGMSWELDASGDRELRTILEFDDDAAMVRSAHVRAEVLLVVSQPAGWDIGAGDMLGFGIAIDDRGDVAALRSSLAGEQFVVFLNRSAVFDYERDRFGVVVDGGLLCRRVDGERIECPALPPEYAGVLDIAGVRLSSPG